MRAIILKHRLMPIAMETMIIYLQKLNSIQHKQVIIQFWDSVQPRCHVITTSSDTKSYSTGTNMVELSFDGEDIYKQKYNGPYTIVFDLYYETR